MFAACAAMVFSMVSCKNGNKKAAETATEEPAAPEYTVVEKEQVDLSQFPQDADGYYVIFDGTSTNGWRGYGKDALPARWSIEDGCLKFTGTGSGEGQTGEGGDVIFAHKFQNFQLELEWKVSKGGNSGIFYLAQEVTTKKEDGQSATSLSTSPLLNIRCLTTQTILTHSLVLTATVSPLPFTI